MQENQSQQPNKEEEQMRRAERKRLMKRISLIAVGVLIIGGLGAFIWHSGNRASVPESEIISRKGIHWHTQLKINIKGKEIAIPANIGIGMRYAGYPLYDPMMMMTDMHTHDDSGTIHWEVMERPVKKEDVRLASFFAIWGKKFTSSCIFDYCNGPQGRLTFKVNGQDNQDFENYFVKDKDTIEIVFE